MREISPITISKVDFEKIEARIKRVFKEIVYIPILKELSFSKSILNSRYDLIKALETGRITYRDGFFRGRFDASTTRELKKIGAKWKDGEFQLSSLPTDMQMAVAIADSRFQRRVSRIDQRLKILNPAKIAESVKIADLFKETLTRTDKAIGKSLKKITVYPELSEKEKQKIADEWANNMDLWINNFAEHEIRDLRKKVAQSVLQGNRHEAITKTIQRSYGVTESKAKFLARQETNLLLTKFKETRYTNVGINEYKWKCVAGSKNHPVRPAHKKLDGKIFSWDTPPITSEKSQPERRNNPGQDFNCRCQAIPLIKV